MSHNYNKPIAMPIKKLSKEKKINDVWDYISNFKNKIKIFEL